MARPVALNVNLTPQAVDDLYRIREWIARDSERAADRTVNRILQTAAMFSGFPMLGRIGRIEGTREFSVVGLSYLIVYAIASESEIDVLTVVHTRRRYPH